MNTRVSSFGGEIRSDSLPALFAPRGQDTHKGSFGTVGVIGGGRGMEGAALLAARAALKTGAGKVLVGFAQAVTPLVYDAQQPELMLRDARSLVAADWGVTAWVAGCGMGSGAAAVHALSELFAQRRGVPLVLDAGGLNMLADGSIPPNWGDGPVILTPHPAEAARLLGIDTVRIQADRPGAAQALARRHGAWIVLKGSGTVICDPDGLWRRNTSGNPGLATAGTGDVLAGMLGSLIAQRLPLDQAVAGAVWLHGAAADALVAQGLGPIGLTASELVDTVRKLRNGGQTA